jgi:tRNA (adenine37-N6)-methyltransferase
MSVNLHPIGFVVGGRIEPVDDGWGDVEAMIVLDTAVVGPHAAVLEVVYLFHLVEADAITRGTRRPRGNPDWPAVGILAQRAKARPNRIGVSRCELLDIDGPKLKVRGLDAVDGTPVLDLKPFMVEFAPKGPVFQPEWASELMRHYW